MDTIGDPHTLLYETNSQQEPPRFFMWNKMADTGLACDDTVGYDSDEEPNRYRTVKECLAMVLDD